MTAANIPVDVPPAQATNLAITLPLGLLGFERNKRYELISTPAEAPFAWLQMSEPPGLAFLVVPPQYVLPDYRPEIGAEDEASLQLTTPEDALVLNIVTLRPHGVSTANLKGPVIINRRTWLGKQVVIVNAADYSLHQPLPAPE